jgi:hypothetical protein
MSSTHLITTTAKVETCPRCHMPVLAGLAEGLRAVADLAALNQAGEIAAIVAGLATYTLAGSVGLLHRDASRIAGGLKGPTLAQHQCRRVVPAEHRDTTAAAPAPRPDYDGPPPFDQAPDNRPPPWWIADVRNRAWRRHLAASATQRDNAWGNTRCGLRGRLIHAFPHSIVPACRTCEGAP